MRKTAPVRSAKLLVALPQLGSIQTATSGKVKTKLSGSTPITMLGRSSTEIVLPTMLRSESNCDSHRRLVITTQPAHVVSSAAVKSRPIAAVLPNTSKKFGETRALKSLTWSCVDLIETGCQEYAATISAVWVSLAHFAASRNRFASSYF